jgi:hypothetical protein
MQGSHGGEDVHVGLLGCNAVWSSALKIEAVCSTKTLVSAYQFTRRYKPEDQHQQQWIDTAQMKFPRKWLEVLKYQSINKRIRNELNIFNLNIKIRNIKTHWTHHDERTEPH